MLISHKEEFTSTMNEERKCKMFINYLNTLWQINFYKILDDKKEPT